MGKPQKHVRRQLGGYDLNLSRRRLDNGLTLLVSESSRLPTVTVSAYVLAGSDQNPQGCAGLSELTARLLDEGSHRRSARQTSALIENEGGSLNIFARREITGLSFQARSQSLATGLQVLYELLAEPVFPESALRDEKERLLGDLDAMEDEPQNVAGRLFNSEIYKGTPLQYPYLGTRKHVQDLTVEEVRRFHRLKYSPANTVLVVVGDVRPGDVEEAAAERFAGWTNPALQRQSIDIPPRQSLPVLLQEPMPTEQIHIAMGHLGVTRTNPDFHRLQVLDVILGSGPGFTSRIPRILRDDLGLAYLTYSNITASAGLYPGRFVAYLSTSPQNRQEALTRLPQEIAAMAQGAFTDEELETAQDFLTGNFVFDFESNDNVGRFLLATELFGLGIDYPDRYPEMIRQVSRQDVRRVAERYLDPVNCTTVIVGPPSPGQG
ncbi:MAG TPA: pitrilysin family protein [Acidobacteriota bacterium]|nr:pitrilysin family protein [Acidobacteriota bacterium]